MFYPEDGDDDIGDDNVTTVADSREGHGLAATGIFEPEWLCFRLQNRDEKQIKKKKSIIIVN